MMVSIAGATSRRVLVVEDEYLIAKRIAGELAKLGIETVGPAGTVAQALLGHDQRSAAWRWKYVCGVGDVASRDRWCILAGLTVCTHPQRIDR